MSIRGKVVLILAAHLLAVAALSAAALGALLLERAGALSSETAGLYARLAGELLRSRPDAGRSGIEKAMPRSRLIDAWAIVDTQGRVVAAGGKAGGMRDKTIPPQEAGACGFNMPPVPLSTGRDTCYFLASAPLSGYLPADTGVLVMVLAVAVIVMLTALYFLLARLVVNPVYELAAASRLLSGGAQPSAVAGQTRRDEMGSLIRSFNEMAREVTSYRNEMEKKVEEATEKRLSAEASLVRAQRINATSRLAAGVAHEINNPLSGVINAISTLSQEDVTPAKRTEYLSLAKDGLERIRSVVQQMLSFQKGARAGPVDLCEVVREALSLASSGTSGISVYTGLPDMPVVVEGRSSELIQVLLNVVLNSADALAGTKDPHIRVTVRPPDAGTKGFAEIEIEDNGCGMDPDTIEHAPELFYSGKPGGTGLGLAISHTIVQNHDGRLQIESGLGEGTTVRIMLPATGREV